MRQHTVAALAALVVVAIAFGVWLIVSMSATNDWRDHLAPAGGDLAASALPPPVPQSGWELPGPNRMEVSAEEDLLTPERVRAIWEPMASVAAENKWTAWGYVTDADTGEVLLDVASQTGHTPASTMKVLTGLIALEDLDLGRTLRTGTSLLDTTLYLWGEGDLLLDPGVGTKGVEGAAGLATLAQETADQLKDRQRTTVELIYQDELFDGPKRSPLWKKEEVDDFAGDVGPFAFETGRTSTGAWEFVEDSAKNVAESFVQQLKEQGISVSSVRAGAVAPGSPMPPSDSVELAFVESAPVYEQIAFMLRTSDNTLAEQYCHLAAQQSGAATSFEGSTEHLKLRLGELGVPTEEMSIKDCSGLSNESKVSASSLVGALRASVQPDSSATELIRILPRGGMEGTLDSRFEDQPSMGNIQAKTGSLGSVSSMAGVLTTKSGQNLLFAVGVDDAGEWMGYYAREPIDQFLEDLANQ